MCGAQAGSTAAQLALLHTEHNRLQQRYAMLSRVHSVLKAAPAAPPAQESLANVKAQHDTQLAALDKELAAARADADAATAEVRRLQQELAQSKKAYDASVARERQARSEAQAAASSAATPDALDALHAAHATALAQARDATTAAEGVAQARAQQVSAVTVPCSTRACENAGP